MKALIALILFFVTYFGSAQNNYIVKTEDGRRVLLKADYTWEYIDLVAPDKIDAPVQSIEKSNACKLDEGFTEPKLNSKIQSQLKKGRATITHIKKKVAKDYNCDPADVILLSAKEQKEKGTYNFCVKGEKVSYKRMGHSIIKKGNLL